MSCFKKLRRILSDFSSISFFCRKYSGWALVTYKGILCLLYVIRYVFGVGITLWLTLPTAENFTHCFPTIFFFHPLTSILYANKFYIKTMLLINPVLCNSPSSSISSTLPFWSSVIFRGRLRRKTNFVVQLNFFTPSAFLNKSSSSSLPPVDNSVSFSDQPEVVRNSLRLLQWDKLSHSVASFAGTSLGQQATEVSLTLITICNFNKNQILKSQIWVQLLKRFLCGAGTVVVV